jgi:4-phytase / acid phosphatase
MTCNVPGKRVHRRRWVGWFGTLWLMASLPHAGRAADAQDPGSVRLVLVLSRHGVRSPTAEPGAMDAFSSKPWPAWPVQPGYLTPHGKQLMSIMGRWYRTYYAGEGLLPAQGCLAPLVFVLADDEERTLESARGLMDGFDPQCATAIHPSPKRGQDALFAHDFSNATDADREQAVAAVMGRIGGDPRRLASVNAALLGQMQAVLFGCEPRACDAAKTAGKHWLKDQDASIKPSSGDGLLSIKSPLHNASTFAENFFLEYVEGMPMQDVAWGRVTPAQVGQLLALHSIYSDVSLRTPFVARAYAGPLAERILATLQQAAGAKAPQRAIGDAQAKMIFLVGHDTNIETLAGLLDLHWLLDEPPADPTSTGGALVFELRQSAQSGAFTVRAYYVSQSMEQMRNGTPLDLDHPPIVAPIAIPGCSDVGVAHDCRLDRFARLIQQKVAPQQAP